MCNWRSLRSWLWKQSWPCIHVYDKCPPKLLSCISLGPGSVTGRGKNNKQLRALKVLSLREQLEGKQAISNRDSYCLCHNIKMPAVQKGKLEIQPWEACPWRESSIRKSSCLPQLPQLLSTMLASPPTPS